MNPKVGRVLPVPQPTEIPAVDVDAIPHPAMRRAFAALVRLGLIIDAPGLESRLSRAEEEKLLAGSEVDSSTRTAQLEPCRNGLTEPSQAPAVEVESAERFADKWRVLPVNHVMLQAAKEWEAAIRADEQRKCDGPRRARFGLEYFHHVMDRRQDDMSNEPEPEGFFAHLRESDLDAETHVRDLSDELAELEGERDKSEKRYRNLVAFLGEIKQWLAEDPTQPGHAYWETRISKRIERLER